MVLMYSTAVERIRRWYFELFWYTHHLFIIFYGMLFGHGFTRILEVRSGGAGVARCTQRTAKEPTFWMWCIGPALLYLVERLIRVARGSVQTIVYQAIQHPSKVIEVRLKVGETQRSMALFVCF